MKEIFNTYQSIGENYPIGTGRSKVVRGDFAEVTTVALLTDSTGHNGAWVQENLQARYKTATVTHQIAVALAQSPTNNSYHICNFGIDGATTTDILQGCYLNKVIYTNGGNDDNPELKAKPIEAVIAKQPEVVILSVGGNNYREAVAVTLTKYINLLFLLLRITPASAMASLKDDFTEVKETLKREYKQIIDTLVKENKKLRRLVLVSQYYPDLFNFYYFIYSGFSHIAHAERKGQTPYELMQATMNELYREIVAYTATKGVEAVFVDNTSSMSPNMGNHVFQIEPNEQGSKIMGELIAEAIETPFPSSDKQKPLLVLKKGANGNMVKTVITAEEAEQFQVKSIDAFIKESRYRHIGLFFAPETTLRDRFWYASDLILGRQFDVEYNGVPAFGLLDASLLPIIAHYLHRVALNPTHHALVRVSAAVVAAPILLVEHIIGLALLLVLALPIVGLHAAVKQYKKPPEEVPFVPLYSSHQCGLNLSNA